MKDEYKIMNFVRGLKDPQIENDEIKDSMLKQVYFVQFGGLLISLIPTAICFFVKLSKFGLEKSDNLLMAIIIQTAVVVYATQKLAERYR